MPESSFVLKPIAPFSLNFTAWALKRRPNDNINLWDGKTYRRAIVLEGRPVKISLTQEGTPEAPRLRVFMKGEFAGKRSKDAVANLVERMFGIRKDLSEFYDMAGRDKKLNPLVRQFSGLKPPRFPSIFEALVNAFACQQVSLILGILLLNRLSAAFGMRFEEENETLTAFPLPGDLAGLTPADFRNMGFSSQNGRAIMELSQSIVENGLDLDILEGMGNEAAMEYLLKIRGVGRWSAEYVLLRGLGRIDTFPGDDVGGQKNIQSFFQLEERPDFERIKKVIGKWQPYAGFIYFHFLLRNLKERGSL